MTEKLSHKALYEFLALTILLYGLRIYIATVIDIGTVGWINPYRAMNRTGVGETDLAATLFGLNVSLGFAGLVPVFVKYGRQQKTFSKVLLFISFVMSLVTVLHLTNRTGLLVMILCIVFSILYLSPKQNGRLLLMLLFIGILVLIFIPSTRSFLSDFAESYQRREEVEVSGGLLNLGNRSWRWVDAIKRVFTNPFGWDGQVEYNYVHNLWLDVARVTGIIPFFLIVCATISGYNNARIVWHVKNDEIVLLLIGLSVATFASAFVEPVLDGPDQYFYMMCMIWGITCQYRIKTNNVLSTSTSHF